VSARTIFSAAVLAVCVVVIVVLAGSDIFDDGGGSAKPIQSSQGTGTPATRSGGTPASSEESGGVQDHGVTTSPASEALPENPDDLPGTDRRSLTRPANLRKALRILERERTHREGVFDGLRVAPGRIDTTIDSAQRKLTLQIRPDFKISFRVDSAFPNDSNPNWRKTGLGAGAVDTSLPQRMLRRIDRTRHSNAARDIDYFVIDRDIIDFHVNYGAYFKRGPHPRIVTLEKNGSLRGIS
jgi:hypothetical protein